MSEKKVKSYTAELKKSPVKLVQGSVKTHANITAVTPVMEAVAKPSELVPTLCVGMHTTLTIME